MHYSQKKRYYFFIAILKFKTILSYYPPLAQASHTHFGKLSEFAKVNQLRQLADFPSSHTRLCQLADFPSLILRSRFAQGSLKVRSRFALAGASFPPCLSFAYDCATLAPHTLANFQSLPKLISCPLAGASFPPPMLILRHILGCASSPTFLRLSFAQGSMRRILNFELMGLLGLGEVMF